MWNVRSGTPNLVVAPFLHGAVDGNVLHQILHVVQRQAVQKAIPAIPERKKEERMSEQYNKRLNNNTWTHK
jgi:hypothetical protein